MCIYCENDCDLIDNKNNDSKKKKRKILLTKEIFLLLLLQLYLTFVKEAKGSKIENVKVSQMFWGWVHLMLACNKWTFCAILGVCAKMPNLSKLTNITRPPTSNKYNFLHQTNTFCILAACISVEEEQGREDGECDALPRLQGSLSHCIVLKAFKPFS